MNYWPDNEGAQIYIQGNHGESVAKLWGGEWVIMMHRMWLEASHWTFLKEA